MQYQGLTGRCRHFGPSSASKQWTTPTELIQCFRESFSTTLNCLNSAVTFINSFYSPFFYNTATGWSVGHFSPTCINQTASFFHLWVHGPFLPVAVRHYACSKVFAAGPVHLMVHPHEQTKINVYIYWCFSAEINRANTYI